MAFNIGNAFSGGALAGFFGGDQEDPSKEAMKYFNQIPGTMKPYYDPFIQAGKNVLPGLQDKYQSLMNDPSAILNKIGSGYKESPGFQFALKKALGGANHAAAAGGMAGSPQHEQQNMELASQIASQDFNNWLGNALGLFGTGLSGEQNIYNTGYGASTDLAKSLAEMLGAQGQLAYSGAANRNMTNMGNLGSILGFAGNMAKAGGFF